MRKEFDLKVARRDFYEGLINECSRLKKYEHALYYCNVVLEDAPQDVDLLYTKVLLLNKNYMFHEALEALELVKKCDVDHLYSKDAQNLHQSIVSSILYL